MIKSMTGFGRAEVQDSEHKFTVEMKSVNHRYLDFNIRMPKKLSFFENGIRTLLKEYMQRGKVDVFITYEDFTQTNVVLQYKKEIAARYFELRQSVLSKENIMAEFNNFKASIPQEVLDRETAKWNTAEHPIPGYDISQIEEYINIVFPRLDNRFSGWK